MCDTEYKMMMVPYYSNVSIINFEQVNAGWVIAKIDAYGFEIRLIYDNLSKREAKGKLTVHLVHGEKCCMVYHKGQSLGHCFLTFFIVTCSTSSKLQI